MILDLRHQIICVMVGIYIYTGMMACAFANVDNPTNSDNDWLELILGIPKAANLKVSDQEIQSLGCMIGGVSVAIGAIILSSTAIIATGGRGAATVTEVAVPVLAAATMAGCVVGSSSALGFVWTLRNKEKLFGKIINVIPTEPLTNILPKSSLPLP